MADESTPKAASGKTAKPPAKVAPASAATPKGEAAGAKAAKAKPPKPEDKPFDEFIRQYYLPGLEAALKKAGIGDLQLAFEKQPLAVTGNPNSDPYWQVIGQWQAGARQFNIAFLEEDIAAGKVFSCATQGATASTLEQFMGDERRITLDLMVLYTLQRLNGQKWLKGN